MQGKGITNEFCRSPEWIFIPACPRSLQNVKGGMKDDDETLSYLFAIEGRKTAMSGKIITTAMAMISIMTKGMLAL
jgi:hypothetical protein